MPYARMTHLPLSISFLACMVSVAAVRYGDYSVARMPQYGDQHEESDIMAGQDEYSDKSPDAPASLDYKYEEEHHGKSNNLRRKDNEDERMWDKPIKKKRKPLTSRSDFNSDLDKYTLDEIEPEMKSEKKFVMHRSNFRRRNFGNENESERRMKHKSINRSDQINNVENKSGYVHKENLDIADGVDTEELNHYRYRATTQRKQRRKPRDRILHQTEWRQSNDDAKLDQEEVDTRSDRGNSERKSSRNFGGVINHDSNKNNYDYNEYYDMKRVQNMRSRLPALFRQAAVRTTKTEIPSNSEHWLNRRADLPSESSVIESIVPEVTTAATNTTIASTTTTAITKSTSESKVEISSDLSLAEKSRLSILKKVQRKENLRNVSLTTKPPVLLQVTRKMQTMVMVEPQSPEAVLRARNVWEDSPERLKRARRLMRQKLMASARNIHELTDNWDEMICDYIDVSLLDTDAAACVKINTSVTLVLLLLYLL